MATKDECDSETFLSERTTVLPRLPLFSGEGKDSPCEVWRFEGECLVAEKRREADVRLAIRRSIKGQASLSLLSLGVDATVEQILNKFDSCFAPTETSQTVLSTFYSLRQKEGESAGSFAMRLENCILHAISLKRVSRLEADRMLCEAFGGGLLHQTKAATAYLLDTVHTFDQLKVAVKRKESELGLLAHPSVASLQST